MGQAGMEAVVLTADLAGMENVVGAGLAGRTVLVARTVTKRTRSRISSKASIYKTKGD